MLLFSVKVFANHLTLVFGSLKTSLPLKRLVKKQISSSSELLSNNSLFGGQL